ncbi:uncharacterized protein Bfra_006061 [Botrytis fragariae]|uniref:Uncharacterized protein n=1 Tax=Botrytis fragariae TaxID=1964551 RepID=A0A8H6ASD9_9HELO|nr:uncharacterized protein Bfra_006061 [Botrytis fragariae]KAF5872698.1 hypothetical protein Bfra_006061 [Botrytis fragariae]
MFSLIETWCGNTPSYQSGMFVTTFVFDQATVLEKERAVPILTRLVIFSNFKMTSQLSRRAVQSGVAVIV